MSKVNKFFSKVLNKTSPTIIILTNSKELIATNRYFFCFFNNFNDFNDFKKTHNCVLDLFEKVDEYGIVYKDICSQKFIKEVIKNGEKNYKLKIKKNDKKYIFKIEVQEINDINKELKYLINLTDITNFENYKSKLKDKLKEDIDKAKENDLNLFQEAKFIQMGELVKMIAHQWRQPLTAISSAASDIEIKKELGMLDDSILTQNITSIIYKTQKMSETINDFIEFFKSNNKNKKFNILITVNELLSLIKTEFEFKKININININKYLKVDGKQNEFEQVLLNILSNAKDAFEDIKIDNKKIYIYTKEEENILKVIIEDNANGIDEKIIDRIFEPYFTTKEEGKGTGLGLYISKVIIENNFNGKLKVENIFDNEIIVGTRFKLILNT